jgi:hypothetical protein
MVLLFRFDGRDAADGLKQPAIIEPVHPSQRGVFDRLEVAPRSAPMDHLGLVEAIDGCRQSVVIAVAGAADRRLDPSFGTAFGLLDWHVLGRFRVVDEAATPHRSSVMQRLLERF